MRCCRHAVALARSWQRSSQRARRAECRAGAGMPAADVATRARSASRRDFGAHPESRTEWWYVTGALAAGDARLGLPDHLLSRRDRHRRRGKRAASRRASCCSRMAPSPTSRRDACATTSASRAAASASPRPRSATPRSCCATGASRAAAAPARAATPRAPRATAPASPSTSSSRRRSRCCCRAKAASRARARDAEQTSRYYSEPQLAVRGTLALDGRPVAVTGRAWLDHEWSDAYLDPERRRLGLDRHEPRRRRRADGVSHAPRRRQHAVERRQPSRRRRRDAQLRRRRGRASRRAGRWTSPASIGDAIRSNGASPRRSAASACARCSTTRSSTAAPSTGAIYWEGLSLLVDASGARVGRGYLEMTGYAAPPRALTHPCAGAAGAQCAPPASTATFFARLRQPDQNEQRRRTGRRTGRTCRWPPACRPAGRSGG